MQATLNIRPISTIPFMLWITPKMEIKLIGVRVFN